MGVLISWAGTQAKAWFKRLVAEARRQRQSRGNAKSNLSSAADTGVAANGMGIKTARATAAKGDRFEFQGVVMGRADNTSGKGRYTNYDGVEKMYQLGGTIIRGIKSWANMVKARIVRDPATKTSDDVFEGGSRGGTELSSEVMLTAVESDDTAPMDGTAYLLRAHALVRLFADSVAGKSDTNDNKLVSQGTKAQLQHDKNFKCAWNFHTQKYELATPCVHYDATVRAPAVVTAMGPQNPDTRLATEEKFGSSARAGALFFEIGGLTFGYGENSALVFQGSFYHAPLSGISGTWIKSMGEFTRPDRQSFVHFLDASDSHVNDWVLDCHGETKEEELAFLRRAVEVFSRQRPARTDEAKREVEFVVRAAAFLAEEEGEGGTRMTRSAASKKQVRATNLKQEAEVLIAGKRGVGSGKGFMERGPG
jgi:hypothetical protein